MRNIFVFGSNLAGRHGKGAALAALHNYGAILGQGIGLQGDAYAIPTKDGNLNTLPITTIKFYVDEFIGFAERNSYLRFYVTPIGCGLAGYAPADIAPMFATALDIPNIKLCEAFKNILRPEVPPVMHF